MEVRVETIEARAYTIPTDAPESDGTSKWDKTTIVVVHARGGGCVGMGYTYADPPVASLVRDKLAHVVEGTDATDPPEAWRAMQISVRNLGRQGMAATGISAVDAALWDLKARLLDLPLAHLLGRFRDEVPIYGSGGFTSYDERRLTEQLGGWVHDDGCRWVKMKVGREPARDPARAAIAKAAIGDADLFVDANGALSVKQALLIGAAFADEGVRWFEEPVSSDDLEGLRCVRDGVSPRIEVAAGEYGYECDYFRRMLAAGAVDVQQADATRCGGPTGFTVASCLCEAFHVDLSAHCAPSLHRHLGCTAPRFRHLEWFHDHVRIEQMIFDGAPRPRAGAIAPDPSRPGLGLELKREDAARYEV